MRYLDVRALLLGPDRIDTVSKAIVVVASLAPVAPVFKPY